jgi:hypothetical protein
MTLLFLQTNVWCLLYKNDEKIFTKFPPRGYWRASVGMSKQAFVTLHRPPPLTFTLESSLLDFPELLL